MLTFIRRWLPSLFGSAKECEPDHDACPDSGGSELRIELEEAGPRDDPEPEAAPPGAWWVPRGTPVLSAPLPLIDKPLDRDLRDHLVRMLDKQDLELPRPPEIVNRALDALRDDNSNYEMLAELIGRDPVLTAGILRVANSVRYRGIREIKQLDLALSRLGRRTLRSIILGVALQGLTIRVGGPERTVGEEIWRRSLVAASMLREFSQRFSLSPEEGFLAGLLHDIGMLAVLKVVHEYQQLHGRHVSRAVFEHVAAEWHEHIGLRLSEAWNLPSPLPELIGNHHRPPAEDDPLRVQRLLLQLADVACAMLGYAPYVPYDFFNLDCVRRLGLKDDAATRALLTSIREQLPFAEE
jgi:HD-like signal output (HDOD) protein